MKESHTLDLLIRVSEGIDLFPNESSGYNSSASSAMGDQSPCWGNENSKRLSIVREESNSSSDRKLNLRTKSRDRAIDRRPLKQVPIPKVPPRSKTTQITTTATKNTAKPVNNTTIIKLSENGTLINNIMISNYDCKTAGEQPHLEATKAMTNGTNAYKIDHKKPLNETKTIKVEVHQSASSRNSNIIPAPPPPSLSFDLQSTASSISGVSSSSNNVGDSSLKCALFEEIKRRAEKKEIEPNVKQENAKKGSGFSTNIKQHDALMEEFKLAHKRMFKNGFVESDKDTHDQREPPPAPTPTPDYDSTPQNSLRKEAPGTIARITAAEMAKANGDAAEIESVDSFKFTNTSCSPPRFPQQYFLPPATGSATMKKNNPQVAVKIDEYQSKVTESSNKSNPSPAKR